MPPDDIALLLRISPRVLLKTGMDRDLTTKGLGPSLRDQTDDLIVDCLNTLFPKCCTHLRTIWSRISFFNKEWVKSF